MKRSIFCIVLCLTLLLSLGMAGCSKKDTVITVASVTAKAGEKVKVPVEISGNPGIMAFLIDFEFDSAKLEYVDFEKGKIFTDFEIAESENSIRVSCIENNDVKKNGEVLILEFKVKGKKGDKVKVTPVITDNSICNYDEELIPAKGESGTVKIK